MKTALRLMIWLPALLSGCALRPASEPANDTVAIRQVVYRIDEQRYFEVVPQESLACARGRLYYTDTAKGIHANVANWDRVREGKFVIDADNEPYLVAPIEGSSSECQNGSGSSDVCASRFYYSQDHGRTWKNVASLLYGEVHLIGSKAYVGALPTDVIDIAKPNLDRSDWIRRTDDAFVIPPPKKPPLDTRLRCHPEGK